MATVLTIPPLSVHALMRLAVCLDCDAAFDLRITSCPACGSRTLYTLARWLAREGR